MPVRIENLRRNNMPLDFLAVDYFNYINFFIIADADNIAVNKSYVCRSFDFAENSPFPAPEKAFADLYRE